MQAFDEGNYKHIVRDKRKHIMLIYCKYEIKILAKHSKAARICASAQTRDRQRLRRADPKGIRLDNGRLSRPAAELLAFQLGQERFTWGEFDRGGVADASGLCPCAQGRRRSQYHAFIDVRPGVGGVNHFPRTRSIVSSMASRNACGACCGRL